MIDASPMFAVPIGPWRDWFAYRPVRTWDGEWVWLRMVSRRRCQNKEWLSYGALGQWWQYSRRGEFS